MLCHSYNGQYTGLYIDELQQKLQKFLFYSVRELEDILNLKPRKAMINYVFPGYYPTCSVYKPTFRNTCWFLLPVDPENKTNSRSETPVYKHKTPGNNPPPLQKPELIIQTTAKVEISIGKVIGQM